MMKKLLRSKYKEIRRGIIDKEDRDNIIFNRVINNTKVIDADTLLIYVSNEEEVDTINIIKYFINKKKIGVPRIDNGIMNFYSINSLDELMEGYFGILEPTTNNIVICINILSVNKELTIASKLLITNQILTKLVVDISIIPSITATKSHI